MPRDLYLKDLDLSQVEKSGELYLKDLDPMEIESVGTSSKSKQMSAVEAVKADSPTAKFYPDTEEPNAVEAVRTGIRSVGGTILGGLPEKGAAAIEAFGSAIGETAAAPDESFKENFKKEYRRILDEGHELKSRYKAMDVVGTGAGYYLDPIAKAIRGLKIVGGVLKTGVAIAAETFAVEGQKGALNVFSRAATEDKPLADIAKEEGLELAGETALGFGVGGAFKLASAPIKTVVDAFKSVAKPILKGAAKLPMVEQGKRIIVENIEKAAKVSNKKEAQALIAKTEKEVATYYKMHNDEIAKSLGNDALADTLLQPMLELEESMALEAIEAIGKRAPKDLAENLSAMQGVAQQFRRTAGLNFGHELDDIAREAGDAIVNFSDELGSFYSKLSDATGDALGTFDGKVFKYAGKNPAIRKLLEYDLPKLLKNDLSMREAMATKVKLGQLIDWSDSATGSFDTAFKDLWTGVRGKITQTLPEDAMTRYNLMNDSWVEVMRVMGNIRKIDKNFGVLSGLSEGGSQALDEAFESRLSGAIKDSATLYGFASDMSKKGLKIGAFTPEEQKLIGKTVSQLRQVKDIRKLSKIDNMMKNLKKIASDDTTPDARVLSELLDNNKFERDVRKLYQQIDVHKKIKDALINPTDKKKVSDALEFVAENASSIQPDVKEAIFRSAHFQRKALFKPELHNMLDVLESQAPKEVDEILTAIRLEPRLQDAMLDKKWLEAFVENDILFKDVLKTTGLMVGGFSVEQAIPGNQYIVPIMLFWKALKNPQALAMMVEKLPSGTFKNKALINAFSVAARQGARLVSQTKNREGAKEANKAPENRTGSM